MKLKIIAALLFTVVFFNCNSQKTSNIEGSWYIYSIKVKDSTEIINYKKYEEYDGCFKKHYVVFKKNTFNAVKIDFHTCEETYSVAGSYKVTNNEIVMVSETQRYFEGEPTRLEEKTEDVLKFSIKNDALIMQNNLQVITYKKMTEAQTTTDD